MIEKEFKKVINKTFGIKLLDKLKKSGKVAAIVQTNFYYDTKNYFLLQHGFTLRLRQIDKKLIWQFKGQKLFDKDLQSIICRPEKNIGESFVIPLEMPNELKNKLSISINDSMYLIGSLNTVRYKVNINNCEVSVDFNSYFGTSDVEVEIEGSSISNINNTLHSLSIKDTKNPQKGKYWRMVKQKNMVLK